MLSILLGCGYREVGRDTYDITTALYTVCQRRSVADLDRLEAQLLAAESAGKLTPQESKQLKALVATARAQEWTTACQRCRQLMKAQTKPARPPTP
jgi:multidrug resistance efflux pump